MPKYIYCTKQNCVGRVGNVCQWYNCPFGGRAEIEKTDIKPEPSPKHNTKARAAINGKHWSEDETARLKHEVKYSDKSWNEIAALFGGRSLSSVRQKVYAVYGTISLKRVRGATHDNNNI